MNFTISASMYKEDCTISKSAIKETGDFLDEFDDIEYKYITHGTLLIKSGKRKAALIRVLLIDEAKALNDSVRLSTIADIVDGDTHSAFYALEQSALFKQDVGDDKMVNPLTSGYIETVYVYPEYRGKGIGKYIHKNLGVMIEHYFNVYLHCLVTIPKPQKVSIDGCLIENLENPEEEAVMLKRMVKVLKNNSFIELGSEGYYARAYPEYCW